MFDVIIYVTKPIGSDGMSDEKAEKMRQLADRLEVAWEKYQEFMAKPLVDDTSMKPEEIDDLKKVSKELRDAEKEYHDFLMGLGKSVSQ